MGSLPEHTVGLGGQHLIDQCAVSGTLGDRPDRIERERQAAATPSHGTAPARSV